MDRQNPVGPDEWQLAADGASFALGLQAAQAYGLLAGGPTVDVARCEDVLLMARDRGIEPRPLEELAEDPAMWAFIGAEMP